jgi:biopolymer transport protein ExbB
MNTSPFRATFAVIFALAMLTPASPLLAQQKAAPAPQQAPVSSQPPVVSAQPPVVPAQAAAPVQAPAPSAAVQSVPAPAAPDATAIPADSGGRSLKSTVVALHELSPWSMFLSADIIVKAVMIGLAFASLVTWTVFIAKMIELSLVQRKLRAALGKIKDARSLAEAQFVLGAKDSVLSALLSAAMGEARSSAGISSDDGIKERAA